MASATKPKKGAAKAADRNGPPWDSGRWICNVCNTARPAGQWRCGACGNAEFRLEILSETPKTTTHNKPNGEPCDWVERLLAGDPSAAAEAKPESRKARRSKPDGGSATREPVTQEIDVDLIEPSPYQPRKDFGDEDLSDLASITASALTLAVMATGSSAVCRRMIARSLSR